MKKHLLGLLIGVTLGGTLPAVPAFADDDVAAYFQDQCVACHKRKKKPLEDKHLTRAEWAKAMDKMLELEKLDPVPSKAFIEKMTDWLTANHGPLDAAQAPTDQPKAQ